jgi:hypothetical protein
MSIRWNEKRIRSGGVSVPTPVNQLEGIILDSLVVDELATEKPVATVEASQIGAGVTVRLSGPVIGSGIEMVSNSRALGI